MKNKILLVEDDADVYETIVSVLENFFEDIEIEHIIDGKDFRRGTWRQGGMKLVILDLMMPGITGFEVCEYLRKNPRTRDVPILALTGYDTLQNEIRIKKAGATAYMAKPFEVDGLIKEIRKFIK